MEGPGVGSAAGCYTPPGVGRCSAGDFVTFEAEADCLVALTACPRDQNACNGWTITDIKVISE